LDAALADKFNLIASYVALAIECGAVFVVAFGALQAMAALIKAIANGRRRGWKDAKSGSDSQPGSCSGSNFCACRRHLAYGRGADLGRHLKARRHRHHPHHAQLLFGQDIMAFDKSQKAGSEGGAA